jgi:hypothetical protein
VSGYSYSTSTSISDGWILKLNSTGTVLWQKFLGGNHDDFLQDISKTNDGGFVLVGESFSSNTGTLTGVTGNGHYDGWIVKINDAGETQWQKLLGGSNFDRFFSVALTTDGSYVIGGWSLSSNSGTINTASNGNWDAWIVKLDSTGQLKQQQLVGGAAADGANATLQSAGGNYITAGYSGSSNTGTLTGVSSNGNVDGWLYEIQGENGGAKENIIKGTVFFDQNKNGVKDANEEFYDFNQVKQTLLFLTIKGEDTV